MRSLPRSRPLPCARHVVVHHGNPDNMHLESVLQRCRAVATHKVEESVTAVRTAQGLRVAVGNQY